MTENCTRNCWIAGAVIGLLVWFFTAIIGPLGWFAGIFLGLITAGLMGALLKWLLCNGISETDDSVWEPAGAPVPASSAAAVAFSSESPDKAASPSLGRDPVSSDLAPASSASVADEAVSPSGDAAAPKPEADRSKPAHSEVYAASAPARDDHVKSAPETTANAAPTAKTPAKKPAVAGQPVAKKASAAKPAAKQSEAKKAKPAEKMKPVAAKPAAKARPAAPKAETKPVRAKSPTSVSADDLKQIKGVGPKLEKLLHAEGVTSFAQVAAWGDSEIDRFAGLIGRMGGRIRSDEWVEQARVLASGGETEFSKRVDKGEVY